MPPQLNGVKLLAPHILGVTESYDPAWYDELAALEAGNFWFVARNRLIRWLAQRYISRTGKYLEVGCGTGFVLQMLHSTFPRWKISATEVHLEGIEFARKRVPEGVTFFQMDACAIPFSSEFDVIGAFDVIEHIRDDTTAIGQIHSALKPGGIFFLSVPQHMFLWSKYDQVGGHFRRYSVSELEDKLKIHGFTVIASTSFNSFLLPLMMLSRYLKKRETDAGMDFLEDLRISPSTNFWLSTILKVEFQLVRLGLRFPWGGSRIVVARKAPSGRKN